MLPSHGRFPYASIRSRPAFAWPGGKRLAVHFCLGIEHYAFGEGMTEDLAAGASQPDVLNTSWREYGNRIGAWRILDAFAGYGLPLGILLNSAVCDVAPDLVEACVRAGHEMIAHGHSNSDTMAGMSETEEDAYVRAVAGRIAQAAGAAPTGWASPWIAETERTPDILRKAGFDYLLDWCMDDQPVWMKTSGGPLLSVPYSQELNDSSAIIGRQVGARAFADMIVDQFDEMREQSREQPLVMSVVVHSFIMGQPHRLRALRRALDHIMTYADTLWLTRPGDIANHFRAVAPPRPEQEQG